MRYLKITLSAAVLMLSMSGPAYSAGAPLDNASLSQSVFQDALNRMTPDNPESIMLVASMLQAGMGTEPNLKESFKYYNEASKLNYGPAQERIAGFYFNGTGMRADAKKGMEWLVRAAKNGSHGAMTQLAFRYKFGMDVKQSDKGYEYWASEADKRQKALLSEAQAGLVIPEPPQIPTDSASSQMPAPRESIQAQAPNRNELELDRAKDNRSTLPMERGNKSFGLDRL